MHLTSRLDFVAENFELRYAMNKIQMFSQRERKLEAVEYMAEILQAKRKL
jgi:hypothetical protein